MSGNDLPKVGTVPPIWIRGRYVRSALATAVVVTAFVTMAGAFASSSVAIISIPTDTITRGDPYSTARLGQADTSHVAGQECAFVLSSRNTHHRSIHDNTLILNIAGEEFVLPIERQAEEVSTGVITRIAGTTVTLDLAFGSGNVASVGAEVTMECVPPEPVTTTTVTPPSTTTTSSSTTTTSTTMTLPSPRAAGFPTTNVVSESPSPASPATTTTTTTTSPPAPVPQPSVTPTTAAVPTGVPTGSG
jgi:hypothetical protein